MAGRKSYGKVEGTLLYDQQQPSHNFLRKSVGYVEQFGNLSLLPLLLQPVLNDPNFPQQPNVQTHAAALGLMLYACLSSYSLMCK